MNTTARRQHGFTLWELLMTLLVGGILLGIGVPNVMEFQRNGAMTAAANDLITAILMARTEAVKRQAPVGWCLTDDPMAATPVCSQASVADSGTRGFIVWVDENDNFDANGARILTDATDGNVVVDAGELVIRRTAAPGGRILMSVSCGYASFTPSGVLRQVAAHCNPAAPAAATPRAVLFCDDRGRRASSGNLSSARVVRIDRMGRANVLQETVDVNTWITALAAGGVTATCP
ncbi:MAG: prepilin-type N-terminal cleavage/methylation domain-containing protein [Lysobacterales bacterium]|nr:MAG: prepilin-type N-terminal cleavage/methylation domain-containing protein [Xanthomonadales bacterium]